MSLFCWVIIFVASKLYYIQYLVKNNLTRIDMPSSVSLKYETSLQNRDSDFLKFNYILIHVSKTLPARVMFADRLSTANLGPSLETSQVYLAVPLSGFTVITQVVRSHELLVTETPVLLNALVSYCKEINPIEKSYKCKSFKAQRYWGFKLFFYYLLLWKINRYDHQKICWDVCPILRS